MSLPLKDFRLGITESVDTGDAGTSRQGGRR